MSEGCFPLYSSVTAMILLRLLIFTAFILLSCFFCDISLSYLSIRINNPLCTTNYAFWNNFWSFIKLQYPIHLISYSSFNITIVLSIFHKLHWIYINTQTLSLVLFSLSSLSLCNLLFFLHVQKEVSIVHFLQWEKI